MGRSDSYRCELEAHPGWSKGAARYDDGLTAHTHRRPALTDTSPKRSTPHRGRTSPCPELRTLPSPDLPVQRRHAPHRHTRYDANGNTMSEQTPSYTRYFDWDGRDMLAGVRSTDPAWTDNEYRYDGLCALTRVGDSSGCAYYSWDDPASRDKLLDHPVSGMIMPIRLLQRVFSDC